MTFLQALAYFIQEAGRNLLRSWKVSLLAIVTIAVSLFLAGVFLLVSGNLRQLTLQWQGESKLVVYLDHGAGETTWEQVRQDLASEPWVVQVEVVTAETARERFQRSFPSLADLLEGWDEEPLPPSLEVSLDWRSLDRALDLAPKIQQLRQDPAVVMVDDDHDWLRQLEAVVLVLEALGTILGLVLLAAAIFTISGVIRLTAYLYRDEIAVMRLVGATEFFIRGPFYLEGLFQGFLGGLLAIAALLGCHTLLLRQDGATFLTSVLAPEFLSPGQLLGLIGVGGLSGLVGAVTSLRKEALGQAGGPEWVE